MRNELAITSDHSLDFLALNGGIGWMLSAVMEITFGWEELSEGGVVGVTTGVGDADAAFSISVFASLILASTFLGTVSVTKLWLGDTENRPIFEATSSGDGVCVLPSRLASLRAHSIFAISVANQPGMSGMAQVIMKRMHSMMCCGDDRY